MLSDVHFDDPLLNDAFDFSRYPTLKTRNAKPIALDEMRHRIRGRTPFTSRRSPIPRAEHQRSRNVSEPHVISPTGCDISNLSSDDEICVNVYPGRSPAGVRLYDDIDFQESPRRTCDDSPDISGYIEESGYKSDDDSLYSMDSADQDVHPFLLSMPIIPQIKLERKATVRKPDPAHLLVGGQNRSFLSPRIPDLRTPARMSSRRYGRILSAPTAQTHGRGAFTLQAFRRFGLIGWSDRADDRTTEPAYKRSVSEPTLNSQDTSDDEQELLLKKGTDESSDSGQSSLIDEVRSTSVPHHDGIGSGIDEALGLPHQGTKRSHQRSSVNYSISGIVHAVADGCAPLGFFPRKPRIQLKSEVEFKPAPNAHDPTSRWVPKHGRIVIKVFVPSTDDIWTFCVPQDINLVNFTSTVVTKLGFVVSFSGSVWDEPKYYFRTDERFKSWVKGRIRFGRNLPIVAHVLAPLPLVRLNVDADGCEVWCYA